MTLAREAEQPARPPRAWTWSTLALTLALGALGGWLATLIHLPLAWMMGAMVLTTIAAIAGAPMRMAPGLRDGMAAVLGVLVGSAFTPALLGRIGEWSVTLSVMVVYLLVITVAMWALLRRFAGYDNPTAYFSAVPGGFNEMMLIGTAMGGDVRILALSHALRILFVVLAIPLWFTMQRGYVGGGAPAGTAELAAPLDLALLLACAVAGAWGGRRLRLPAAPLVGPMLLSAGVHLAGLTASNPPWILIALAQLIIGSGVGARFTGTPVRLIAHSAGVALILTLILLAITLGFGVAVHALTGIPTPVLVLAYAPGGLPEMSLIALFLHEDTAFVATHHIVRILIVILVAPLLFHLIVKRLPDPARRR